MYRMFGAYVAVLCASAAFFGIDLAAPISAVWSQIVLASDQSEQHRQALAFLKAAYDRLDGQIRAVADRPGAVSLRSEQAAVVQRMREEASLIVDGPPPEIAVLLARHQTAPPAAQAPAAAPL